MEAPRNEQAIRCPIRSDLSNRQVDMAIAKIKQLKQVVSAKRTSHHELAVLVDLGQLQGLTAQNSLDLVKTRVLQELEAANTASRLVRSDLRLV